jgi:hypothetical protein
MANNLSSLIKYSTVVEQTSFFLRQWSGMPLPSNGRAVGIHGFCIREISYGSLVCSIDKNTGVKPC